jgi:hypothetical protein
MAQGAPFYSSLRLLFFVPRGWVENFISLAKRRIKNEAFAKHYY